MVDHRLMRLGKHPPKIDRRTLRLSRYLMPGLPPPPVSVDNSYGKTSWGMMRNDVLGDCTIAGIAHAVQTWTDIVGDTITLPDETVVDYYSRWCDYKPGDLNTDNGGNELDVLNHWRADDFAGHKLLAYADAFPKYHLNIKQAVYLFGGIYIGLDLPATAQTQPKWDVVPNTPDNQKGSWGGHAVWCCKYDESGITCVTWGALQEMTWAFWDAYCDEAHALFSEDILTVEGKTVAGVDRDTLEKDLHLIKA